MTTIHAHYCEHDQRLYEVVQRTEAQGLDYAINWTSADGERRGVIGGVYKSEVAAIRTVEWFCQDPMVARGAKP